MSNWPRAARKRESAVVFKSFGCRQAYKGFRRPNPQAASDAQRELGFAPAPVSVGPMDASANLDADGPHWGGDAGSGYAGNSALFGLAASRTRLIGGGPRRPDRRCVGRRCLRCTTEVPASGLRPLCSQIPARLRRPESGVIQGYGEILLRNSLLNSATYGCSKSPLLGTNHMFVFARGGSTKAVNH